MILDLAADAAGSTPEELIAYNRNEISKWAKVIKCAGIFCWHRSRWHWQTAQQPKAIRPE